MNGKQSASGKVGWRLNRYAQEHSVPECNGRAVLVVDELEQRVYLLVVSPSIFSVYFGPFEMLPNSIAEPH